MARSDRYAEAFWWVVPIPALVVVAGGLAAVDPSPAGVVGAFVPTLVGLSPSRRTCGARSGATGG